MISSIAFLSKWRHEKGNEVKNGDFVHLVGPRKEKIRRLIAFTRDR